MAVWLILFLFVGVLALGTALHLWRAPAQRAEAAVQRLDDAVARAEDLAAATRALTKELEQVGSRVAEEAADRLRALQTALAEADKHVADLERGREAPPEPKRPEVPDPPPTPRPDRAPRLDVTVDDAGAARAPRPGPVSERYREIYALADNGHTLEEIAQRMRMGKGEVQLVLSLRGPQSQ